MRMYKSHYDPDAPTVVDIEDLIEYLEDLKQKYEREDEPPNRKWGRLGPDDWYERQEGKIEAIDEILYELKNNKVK